MKPGRIIDLLGTATQAWLVISILCLPGAGCASKNVNPATARSRTGYVDLYSDTAAQLCWEVGKMNSTNGPINIIFEEYELRAERILRLAFAPGRYQLYISFLNRVVTDPAVAEVTVKDGMVTPVHVTLTETGKGLVETRHVQVTGTWYGRYGRATRLRANETGTIQVNAEPQDVVPYQPKSQMSYAAIPEP